MRTVPSDFNVKKPKKDIDYYLEMVKWIVLSGFGLAIVYVMFRVVWVAIK